LSLRTRRLLTSSFNKGLQCAALCWQLSTFSPARTRLCSFEHRLLKNLSDCFPLLAAVNNRIQKRSQSARYTKSQRSGAAKTTSRSPPLAGSLNCPSGLLLRISPAQVTCRPTLTTGSIRSSVLTAVYRLGPQTRRHVHMRIFRKSDLRFSRVGSCQQFR
jgi:hypothetical protein